MAEKQIAVRYSLKDKELVERAFKSLGDEGEKFLKRLERGGKPASASLKLIDASSREAQDALRGLSANAGTAGNVLAALGPKGLAAAAAIGAVSLAVSKGVKAYAEEERAQLRLQSVLRTTGNAAGVTAGQIDELAERLERTTFFDKGDILQAAAALSTFKAVSGDAFEQTIRLATDMSEVFGGDLVGNARILGKALQDPVNGLSALRRVAGELPEDVQKTVDALAAAGKEGEAVNVILAELEGRMGGAAVAAADGLAGSMDNLSDAFGDFFKSVGGLIDAVGLDAYLRNLGYGIDAITAGLQKLKSVASGTMTRGEWEDKARAGGFVTAATRTSGYAFDAGGNLVRSAAAQQAVKETTRGVEAQARAAGRARQATADTAAAQRELQRATQDTTRAYEDLTRPIERGLDRVQDGFADMLRGAEFTGDSLVNIFKDAAAQITAALIFRPIIAGVTGSLTGGLTGGGAAALPGVSGSLAGGGSLMSLSGLSSVGSGLLNGFSTPVLSPGIAFDVGKALGLSGGTVGALHQGIANFTPLSGLSSLGGSLLANALGLGGKYSSVTGGIGGVAGTFLGGPLGGAIGSFLGSALGGLFGGGTPHPSSSFEATVGGGGGLGVYSLLAKHMDRQGPQTAADQLGAFLQGAAQLGGFSYRSNLAVRGIIDPGGARFQIPGVGDYGFDPTDAGSVAAALRDVTVALAGLSGVADNQVVKALQNVNTAGRDAAGVLAAVGAGLAFVNDLKDFRDALGRDAATTTASPEEQLRLAREFFNATSDRAAAGQAGAQDVQAAALAYLQASQAYAGRASGTYAGDLAGVQGRLTALAAGPPRFAGGGEFEPGTFIVHPGETVMTSATPGRVLTARETQQAVGGAAQEVARYRAQSMQETQLLGRKLDDLTAVVQSLASALRRAAVA